MQIVLTKEEYNDLLSYKEEADRLNKEIEDVKKRIVSDALEGKNGLMIGIGEVPESNRRWSPYSYQFTGVVAREEWFKHPNITEKFQTSGSMFDKVKNYLTGKDE